MSNIHFPSLFVKNSNEYVAIAMKHDYRLVIMYQVMYRRLK